MSTPDSLEAIASTGDRRATLEALRGVVARAIDAGPPARDLAALTRRLCDITTELAGLPDDGDDLDLLLSTPTGAMVTDDDEDDE